MVKTSYTMYEDLKFGSDGCTPVICSETWDAPQGEPNWLKNPEFPPRKYLRECFFPPFNAEDDISLDGSCSNVFWG